MVKINMASGILTNKDAVERFSGIVLERPAGREALRADLKNWFAKEGINVVRTSGRTSIINPILASKGRDK